MSDHFYLRRCHICGELNKFDKDKVCRCKKCDKPIAPFLFFIEVPSDHKMISCEHPKGGKPYLPVIGLSVYW